MIYINFYYTKLDNQYSFSCDKTIQRRQHSFTCSRAIIILRRVLERYWAVITKFKELFTSFEIGNWHLLLVLNDNVHFLSDFNKYSLTLVYLNPCPVVVIIQLRILLYFDSVFNQVFIIFNYPVLDRVLLLPMTYDIKACQYKRFIKWESNCVFTPRIHSPCARHIDSW